MEFTSAEARSRYDEVVAVAARTVVGLDFDGTLAPIVADPEAAHIHPEAHRVLVDLADVVGAVAVITGRPARQAVALGGLDEVGEEIAARGHELHVFGQYGNERWSSSQPYVRTPLPPHGLASFQRDLPRELRAAGVQDAFVEEKGLAVAVHTRRLDDPETAFRALLPRLRALATRHDLMLEPGRNVIEVRSAGMHKGIAVHQLAARIQAGGFLFAGDDLGDVEAFDAVEELADSGLATLLVCSASEEESALAERADVVVPGPEGVLELLRQLTADAS
ncbi:trehalose-phosphatase [Nocardioides limicola]|uniref:trehalose-phosphatase n=1 Tax=Nocardioides limicola TaxID=2803368 RepID=UPI00193B44A9|nr:trehalose-phosphatase [Nocardioides sp. DJM-14]